MMRESTPRDSGSNQSELLESHPLPRMLPRGHARCLAPKLVAGVDGGKHESWDAILRFVFGRTWSAAALVGL